MSIRTKVVLFLIPILGVIIFSALFYLQNVVLGQFQQLENFDAQRELKLAINIVTARIDRINSTGKTFSDSDETYSYVNKQTSEYTDSNYSDSILKNLNLNFVLIENNTQKTIFKKLFLDSINDKVTDPNAYLDAAINRLNTATINEKTASGILSIDGFNPIIFVKRPIVKSDGTGVQNGSITFARVIDNVFNTTIATTTLIPTKIFDSSIQDPAVERINIEVTKAGSFIDRVSDSELSAYQFLKDSDGNNSLVIQVTLQRNLYQQGVDSTKITIVAVVAISMITLFLFTLLVNISIVNKLTKLSEDVKKTKLDKNHKITPIPGNDEISDLSKDISESYSSLSIAEGSAETSKKEYQLLFDSMLNGFARCRMIFDERGNPIDFTFIRVNAAFEKLIGLKNTEITGKNVTTVLPSLELVWMQKYGDVVKTGEPSHFEQYTKSLNKFFEVNAFKSGENEFAAVFTDVTERRSSQNQLEDKVNELQRMNKLLLGRELKMAELKNEISNLKGED